MAAQLYDSTIPLSWEENIAAVLFLTILLPDQREFFLSSASKTAYFGYAALGRLREKMQTAAKSRGTVKRGNKRTEKQAAERYGDCCAYAADV